MKGDYRIYIGVVLLLLIGMLLLKWTRPEPLDWSYSYSKHHSRPFGCELLYRNLDTIFPGHEVRSGDKTLYRAASEGDLDEANIIMIGEEIHFSEEDRDMLFQKVRDGANVFISARSLDRAMLDSLPISMNHVFPWEAANTDKQEEPEGDTSYMDLKAPKTPSGGYPFSKGLGNAYFEKINPNYTEPLGYDGDDRMVFVRSGWGEGAFFLHSRPLAFTNYYLAQDSSYPYAFKTLSHLPLDDVYWDEHYKPLREGRGGDPTDTPLRFILQNPPLRASLYTLLIGVLLLLTFGSKRKQRAMPVIQPPSNSTLSYVDVLGTLYFEDGGHQRIGKMRAQQFLMRIRQRIGIQVEGLTDKEEQEKVAARIGGDVETVKEVFLYADKAIKGVTGMTQKELLSFEKAISAFWKEAGKGRKG